MSSKLEDPVETETTDTQPKSPQKKRKKSHISHVIRQFDGKLTQELEQEKGHPEQAIKFLEMGIEVLEMLFDGLVEGGFRIQQGPRFQACQFAFAVAGHPAHRMV